MNKDEFKKYVQEQFRKRKHPYSTSIAILQPEGITFEDASDVVESMGGFIGKFPLPQKCKEVWWSINFETIRDQQIKSVDDFKEEILSKIRNGAKKFLYIPKVYPYQVESIDFEDAKKLVESLGGRLYHSAIKDVWRIDCTTVVDDFKDYLYEQSCCAETFSINKNDCPLINYNIVIDVINYLSEYSIELELNENENCWTFKRISELSDNE